MRLCNLHHGRLRQVIEIKGMGHLIPSSPQKAVERMQKKMNKQLVVTDPLLTAQQAMLERCINDVGTRILDKEATLGVTLCPLCEGEAELPGLAENWIDGATSECLKECREKNFVATN